MPYISHWLTVTPPETVALIVAMPDTFGCTAVELVNAIAKTVSCEITELAPKAVAIIPAALIVAAALTPAVL